MGTEIRGQILHQSPDAPFVALEPSFVGLQKHTAFDYLQSGSVVRPSIYLHPIEGKRFDFVKMISHGVILEQEIRRQYKDSQITSSPGFNNGLTFTFPHFEIVGVEGFEEISGLIYPTAEYARQVAENDILFFEEYGYRSGSATARKKHLENTQQRNLLFPKYEIPFIRLNEVFAGS